MTGGEGDKEGTEPEGDDVDKENGGLGETIGEPVDEGVEYTPAV